MQVSACLVTERPEGEDDYNCYTKNDSTKSTTPSPFLVDCGQLSMSMSAAWQVMVIRERDCMSLGTKWIY
jgi:hypothetical protein